MGDGTFLGVGRRSRCSRGWVAAVGLGLKATLLPQAVSEPGSGQCQRDTPEQAGWVICGRHAPPPPPPTSGPLPACPSLPGRAWGPGPLPDGTPSSPSGGLGGPASTPACPMSVSPQVCLQRRARSSSSTSPSSSFSSPSPAALSSTPGGCPKGVWPPGPSLEVPAPTLCTSA